MKKRTPACNVRETRARLEEELDDWVDGRQPLPSWAKVIAREAGVTAEQVADAESDSWYRRHVGRALAEQVGYASSSQVCGYGFVWNKYTGEGRRFRRRLARTKLSGLRRGLGGSVEHHRTQASKFDTLATKGYAEAKSLAEQGRCEAALDKAVKAVFNNGGSVMHGDETGSDSGEAVIRFLDRVDAFQDVFKRKCLTRSHLAGLRRRRSR